MLHCIYVCIPSLSLAGTLRSLKELWYAPLYIRMYTFSFPGRDFKISKGAVVCSEAQLEGDISIGKSKSFVCIISNSPLSTSGILLSLLCTAAWLITSEYRTSK